jgi:hypothetical protein
MSIFSYSVAIGDAHKSRHHRTVNGCHSTKAGSGGRFTLWSDDKVVRDEALFVRFRVLGSFKGVGMINLLSPSIGVRNLPPIGRLHAISGFL